MERMAVSASAYLGRRFIPLAHRGGSFLPANLGIENTIRAFENAVSLGFEYLETDVHSTKDGHLIAFHDEDFERVTDFAGKPGEFLLEEVKELLVGDREPVPTVDELLEHFSDRSFNIDLKDDASTALLAEAVRRHGAQDRVCVGSFSARRLWHFRKLQPAVTTSASPLGVARLVAGMTHTNGDVYQIPLKYRLPTGAMVNLVTPRMISRIHRAGKKVHVWTIDDDSTMHRLIDWGVDGIVTDRPDLLKAVLRVRGMWSTR